MYHICKFSQLLVLKEQGDWNGAPATGLEPVLPSWGTKSQILEDHAGHDAARFQ